MNNSRLIVLILIVVPFLFSCLPKKPEMSGAEVPSGPLVHALEQQRQSFTGLKATARIEVLRRGRKRSFDNVGIVLDAQRRLRIEVFGPLGQSVITLVWDGKEVMLRLPDDRVMSPGQAGIENVLGIGMEAEELCALLSGTITEIVQPSNARAYCTGDATCVIEFLEADVTRRVQVLTSSSGPAPAIRVVAQERYRSDALVYRARYAGTEETSRFLFPGTVVIENPEKKAMLTIEYAEVDVNVPVADDAFTLGAVGHTRQ